MHELPTATAPTLTTVETTVAGLIGELAPAPLTGGRGRPRILPAMLLWAGLVVCVLRGWTSQRALWRLVSADGLWAFPRVAVTDQAIYRRLAQDGAGVLPELFGPLTTALADRLAPYAATELAPFAAAVVDLDETTLDPVARHLPALHGTPPTACLPGKLAGVFDLRTQLWPHLVVSDAPHQNEKVLARALVATLPPQSLVLADLGYFGFAWFDDLTDGGHYWVSRLRAKTSYRLLHVHFQQGKPSTPWCGWAPTRRIGPNMPCGWCSTGTVAPSTATSPTCAIRSSSRCLRSPASMCGAGTSNWRSRPSNANWACICCGRPNSP